MKALTCEMCGSTDLIKQDGVFVCQSCGTKYSVEEAKRMMVEGTVDVKGTVKIDTSSELKNLYEIARRAKETDNSENAAKYYDQILVKDPSSWEANFFVVYFKAMSCKIAEIWSAGTSISNCVPTVIDLIKNNVPEDEQTSAISEVYVRCMGISSMLSNASRSHYDDIDIQIRGNYTQEYVNNAAAAADIMYTLGNALDSVFGEKQGTVIAESWGDGIKLHNAYLAFLADKQGNMNIMNEYAEKIKKYKPDYAKPEYKTSDGGCYVATAVYGSYDCPEVWTLRRYRDFSLAETWYGRAFIRTYYAISPTLVKWFGNTNWFKKMWRGTLDRMVNNLKNQGFESTPYEDRVW